MKMHIWLFTTILVLSGCGLFTNRQVSYLEKATGYATQVAQEFGQPMAERPSDDGGTIWIYRYTGVTSAMMLPVDEYWCVEYVLTFDADQILRAWVRQDCPPTVSAIPAPESEIGLSRSRQSLSGEARPPSPYTKARR